MNYEHEYLKLLHHLLYSGEEVGDRTGVGTLSDFGGQYKINLQKGFPLLTTKRVYFTGIVRELLWFLNGDTNINSLRTRIWNEWATEDGDLGPIYGKQWTAWETPNGPVNQVAECLRQIKENPNSRRILFHGWNVADLPDESLSPQENVKAGRMALPPCHLLYQFKVYGDCLDMMLTLRSNDMFLGHPFNVASAALLCHMMAQQAGLKPGFLTMSMGDYHIYTNHISQVEAQLRRDTRPLPILQLNKAKDLFSYTEDDFKLVGYNPHPSIKAEVAV